MRLKDKVAIITGAGQGLGASMAYRFAREGAKVVIVDINEEMAQRVERDITGQNGIAWALTGDVTSNDNMKALVAQVVEKYGTIDILVNNAGITRDSMIMKMSEEKWDQVIDINLKGAFNCCQAVLPIMREKRYGKIVNISSAARFGNIGQANYAASKEGLVGLTRALARELATSGIYANALAPGFIESEMAATVPEDVLKRLIQNIPLQRKGTAEEVAEVCLFLASDESSYVTGQVIQVDGGRFMT